MDPATKQEAPIALRYRDDPVGRKVVEDTAARDQTLTAMVGDLKRAGSGGDEIAEVAAGKEPRVGGVFAAG